MRFKSIRTKLLASICLLTLLLVMIVQGINILMLQNTFTDMIPGDMEASLQNAHLQITSKLEKNFGALRAISEMPYMQDTSIPLEERAVSLAGFVEENAQTGYKACAVTDADGRAVLSSGFEIDVSVDSYFQQAIKGQEVVSDPFISRATGDLLIVYAVPYYSADGSIAGVITLDVDALHLSRGFSVMGLGESGVAFAITKDGTTVVSTDEETVREQLNDFEEAGSDPTLAGLVESERKMVEGGTGNGEHDYLGEAELIYYMPVAGTNWSLAVTQAKSEVYGTVNSITNMGLIILVAVVLLSVVVAVKLARTIARPIIKLTDSANALAEGDVDVDVDIDSRDETGMLAQAFRKMTDNIRRQADVIGKIAQGDYTASIPVRSDKDIINKAINHMVDSNNALIGEIRKAATHVDVGASQIAGGAQTLATGSTRQAADMEEFSGSVNKVHNQADTNTELATTTMRDVQESERLTMESLASMQEMTKAMHEINESSMKIANVIKVIEDIAFQTNILALNASVESSRAGQHGKGFAVVAEEVRELAGKSAEASKETCSMIEESILSVKKGVEIAERTAESLNKVGEITARNTKAVQMISEASRQQSVAVNEIDQGINRISKVVQDNSTTAEQSSASAQELRAQSALLSSVVERFKLRES